MLGNSNAIFLLSAVIALVTFFMLSPILLMTIANFGVRKSFTETMVQEGIVSREVVKQRHPAQQGTSLIITLVLLAVGRICFSDPGDNIDFLEMHDNSYPKEMLDKPWQTPATMQNSWAYHSKDYNWKPASRMLRYLVSNTSMGGNYLLNIGPKADGTIPRLRSG